MKKYSQKQLLEEGFWKGVGDVIGGVARGADYVAGQVAPELQRLYKDPYKAAKGLVGAIKGGEKEIQELYAVVDENDVVIATASNELAAKRSISSSELPPLSVKDKSKLRVVKTQKTAQVGAPLKAGLQGSGSGSSANTSTSPQEISNIKQGLSRKQYNLLNAPTLSYVDPRTRMKYFNVQIEKNGNRMNAIVDLNGNFPTP